MASAAKAMAPLQDAVKLGIATEEEAALLRRWEIYRVQLYRINPQDAPEIDWPVAPGAKKKPASLRAFVFAVFPDVAASTLRPYPARLKSVQLIA